jgi:hypothetical protein
MKNKRKEDELSTKETRRNDQKSTSTSTVSLRDSSKIHSYTILLDQKREVISSIVLVSESHSPKPGEAQSS